MTAPADKKDDPIELWGRNITKLAGLGKLECAINRDAELKRVTQVLARNTENNPLLVGESGVGKRAIIHTLAKSIADGTAPGMLRSKQIVEVDLSLLGAGAKTKQEIEDRMRKLIHAARDRAGEVILFLPSLTRLTGGIPALFSSAINRGEIRVIGIVRPDETKKVEEADAFLLRRFVSIEVKPSTVDESIEIIRSMVSRIELAHKVDVADKAIIAAVKFAKRYVQGAMLPKAAINILDEACAVVRIERDSAVPTELSDMIRRKEIVNAQLAHLSDDKDHDSLKRVEQLNEELTKIDLALGPYNNNIKEIQKAQSRLLLDERRLADAKREDNRGLRSSLETSILLLRKNLQDLIDRNPYKSSSQSARENRVLEGDVALVIAAQTGVPVSSMLEEETEKLKEMEKHIEKRVVGQDSAVISVSKAVRRGRVGLRDPKKPIGSFLFLGPTGVGKTELAKALAEFMFSDEAAMTRLDMSEFMEKHSVARLLGSPPGYADSDSGGFLTNAVRARPYSVILFDEIEKAHLDVFNILLQVLDDGRLTDSRGNLAQFSDSVVILTSNVGSKHILDAPEGTTNEQIREIVEHELRHKFRPEFLNRIDDIIIFNPLTKKNLRGVVDIQLKGLAKMIAERGVKMEATDAAKNKIVDMGYEPAMGARPVKRVILREVQDPLAEAIIKGGYVPGDSVVMDVRDEKFVFDHKPGKV